MKKYIVYILRTSKDTLYTGQTIDLERRLKQHQEGKVGAKYLRMFHGFDLVYKEEAGNLSDALKRELEIKNMTRAQKEALIKLGMIEVRQYIDSDYPKLAKLLKEAKLFDETWESRDNLKKMTSYVAVDKNKIVGNIFVVPYGAKIVLVFRLAVAEKYRNQGIASQLLDFVANKFKNEGGVEIGLFVDQHKEYLQEFYNKRGFNKSKDAFLVMWKPLSGQ